MLQLLEIVFILPNSEEPDEMQHNAALHLGLHCLPEYLFRFPNIQYPKPDCISFQNNAFFDTFCFHVCC